jgi:hypothetical protein
MPVPVWYLPSSHASQLILPVRFVYVPAKQKPHVDFSVLCWYLPVGQLKQKAMLVFPVSAL